MLGDSQQIDDGVCRASLENATKRVDLHGIVGGSKTRWATVTGATIPKLAADLALARHHSENKTWANMANHWLCKIPAYGPMLIRKGGGASWDKWHFYLGDVHGVCGLAWPAVRVDRGGY